MFRTKCLLFLAFIGFLACSGCTTSSWYEGARSSQRLECRKEPLSEYDRCLEQTNPSYDEYQRQRQEVVSDRKSLS
jgi:hypothetical protein